MSKKTFGDFEIDKMNIMSLGFHAINENIDAAFEYNFKSKFVEKLCNTHYEDEILDLQKNAVNLMTVLDIGEIISEHLIDLRINDNEYNDKSDYELDEYYENLLIEIHEKILEKFKLSQEWNNKNFEIYIKSVIYLFLANHAFDNKKFLNTLYLTEKSVVLESIYRIYKGQTYQEITKNTPKPNQIKKMELEPKAKALTKIILNWDEDKILYPLDIAKIIKEVLNISSSPETIRDKWNLNIPPEVSKKNNVKRENKAKLEAEVFSASIVKELRTKFL